ncbi:MAG: 5-oxoprolinase subunit PxpB [Firmicutes bacterium]|jgi:KipI family sensor histidine kinase inhibitor|nr:5-oxoprolinase subunit PxpB [Bacillota bacterium]
MDEIRYLPAGDSAIAVEFGSEISEDINTKVQLLDRALSEALEALKGPAGAANWDAKRFPRALSAVTETVPTYRSLMVHYDPCAAGFSEMKEALEAIVPAGGGQAGGKRRILVVPVLYGGEEGPDLQNVCEHSGLSEEEVIAIHSGRDYRVYMLGFTPGFPYLGGMDERIATPRLAHPRTLIPAGSVGIAGAQTGIYPTASPGGWQLIGRTPLKLYDPGREVPILAGAGDYIRFRPVSAAEYAKISVRVNAGIYDIEYAEEG